MKTKKEKVLVAMSGGVDSSVAAALLLKRGYEVTGAFMINYDMDTQMYADVADMRICESCWRNDYQDAVRVAAKLGIPLLRLDFTKEYKKKVLGYVFREYKAGRTPNPDVLCNKFIKFGVWLKKARELGFDKLATGHYAQNKKTKKQKNKKILYGLVCAKDENKDQTYFLHQLTQKQLQHILFPLGGYLKSEVRKLACRFGLPTADKEESMGICFVGEVNMKDFLKEKIKTKIGDVIMSSVGADGHSPVVIGQHDGLAFYTIGQRIGVKLPITNYQLPNKSKIQNSKPLYVIGKDMKKNQLIVGYENYPLLYKKQIMVGAYGNTPVHWISGHLPKMPLKCLVRLRHRQPLQKCRIMNYESGIMVRFEKPQRAVTPGQFAVFYEEKKSLQGVVPSSDGTKTCLGGGVIR